MRLQKKTLNKTRSREKLVKLVKSTLDIRSQIDVLDKYHMQPLQLRFFYHFLSFTYSAFNNCAECSLIKSILCLKITNRVARNNFFLLPKFNTEIFRFSFNILSIKLFNLFFYKYLIGKKSIFSNFFKISINLFDYHVKFTNSLNN